jgi:hypothetical protein
MPPESCPTKNHPALTQSRLAALLFAPNSDPSIINHQTLPIDHNINKTTPHVFLVTALFLDCILQAHSAGTLPEAFILGEFGFV